MFERVHICRPAVGHCVNAELPHAVCSCALATWAVSTTAVAVLQCSWVSRHCLGAVMALSCDTAGLLHQLAAVLIVCHTHSTALLWQSCALQAPSGSWHNRGG